VVVSIGVGTITKVLLYSSELDRGMGTVDADAVDGLATGTGPVGG
jgi:hypothetical protein